MYAHTEHMFSQHLQYLTPSVAVDGTEARLSLCATVDMSSGSIIISLSFNVSYYRYIYMYMYIVYICLYTCTCSTVHCTLYS